MATITLYYTPAQGALIDDAVWRLSVCVKCTSGLSRERRGLGRLKLAQRYPSHTCLGHHFKVKRSKTYIWQGSVAMHLSVVGSWITVSLHLHPESAGERILIIGQHLAKLWATIKYPVCMFHIFAPPCMLRFHRDAMVLLLVLALSGTVCVNYYPAHEGHESSIAHLRLHKEQRQQIAAKLNAGVTFDDILDTAHMTSSNDVNTMHLLSRKDLSNITRDFGFNRKEVMHQNDADSVAAWVENTRTHPTTRSLVRFVKFQGEDSAYSLLTPNDFMMVIASDAQLLGGRQFCAPTHPVCMCYTGCFYA